MFHGSDQGALPPIVIALCLLCLKALLLGMATAFNRMKAKRYINAEDADWLGGETVAADGGTVARIGRAHRNDLENLLLFGLLAFALLALSVGPVAAWIYSAAFLGARLLHGWAYLAARPAARRNAYTAGFLVIAAMAVHALILAVPRAL